MTTIFLVFFFVPFGNTAATRLVNPGGGTGLSVFHRYYYGEARRAGYDGPIYSFTPAVFQEVETGT